MGLDSVGKRAQKCGRGNRERRWHQIKPIDRWLTGMLVNPLELLFASFCEIKSCGVVPSF